ncbi:MAG: response regulator [Elusimicrobia bacterium]|nr:response regulator [Elusimicrobiota bacterium]
MAVKILIVDDVEETRKLLREVLEIAGYEVLEAKNGVEALQKVEEHLPNLILTDLMMPQMDGFTLNSKLKQNEKTKNIPVVVSTSHKDIHRVFNASDKTAIAGFIEKPYKVDEIWSIIEKLLKK